MIEFLEQPYKATNTQSGFEVLVHGFVILPDGLHAICVSEEGVLSTTPLDSGSITLEWRYKRGRGWFSLGDVGPED